MFIDLEKTFDQVPRKVLWWAMRRLGVEERLIRTIQTEVGVHQGSVLNLFLFIIVMEALLLLSRWKNF